MKRSRERKTCLLNTWNPLSRRKNGKDGKTTKNASYPLITFLSVLLQNSLLLFGKEVLRSAMVALFNFSRPNRVRCFSYRLSKKRRKDQLFTRLSNGTVPVENKLTPKLCFSISLTRLPCVFFSNGVRRLNAPATWPFDASVFPHVPLLIDAELFRRRTKVCFGNKNLSTTVKFKNNFKRYNQWTVCLCVLPQCQQPERQTQKQQTLKCE